MTVDGCEAHIGHVIERLELLQQLGRGTALHEFVGDDGPIESTPGGLDIVLRGSRMGGLRPGVPLTYPAELLASAILALGHGLAMSALVEPESVPDELLGDVLQLLYEGLEARASRDARS